MSIGERPPICALLGAVVKEAANKLAIVEEQAHPIAARGLVDRV